MTVALSSREIVGQLGAKFPGAVEESGNNSVLVKSDSLLPVAEYLKTGEGLKFDYLITLPLLIITATSKLFIN